MFAALGVVLLATALLAAPPVGAVEPIGRYVPRPVPQQPPIPPPNSYLNGPCGVAVDSGGRFYLADHYHDTVDVFSEPSRTGYITQLKRPDDDNGPCAVAVDAGGDLYVAEHHGAVRRYDPDAYPPTAGADPPFTGSGYSVAGVVDPGRATGLAVEAAGEVYVAHRDRVSVYDSAGARQVDVGLGELGEAYGVAVSGFAATAGNLYVADASTGTVKVFDPDDAVNYPDTASAEIAGPPGGFASLRDSSVAVDDASGDVYVLDNTQPALTEQPRARVQVFAADGSHQGHLKYEVVHGSPTGLAVDNSGGAGQGRVYVTSGNTHEGALYVYPPGAAVTFTARPPDIPPGPGGANRLFPGVGIGGPATQGGEIPCEGDSCQVLPPEPVDPTLTTRLEGLGNPPLRYRNAIRDCGALARQGGKLSRQARRTARKARRARAARAVKRLRSQAAKLRKRARRASRAARRCRRDGSSRARLAAASARIAPAPASGIASWEPDESVSGSAAPLAAAGSATTPAATTQGLLPGAAGFDAAAWADGGAAATLAGSHPYRLDFALGLESGDDLRRAVIDLPSGLLANPAATALCSEGAFATPRSSTFGNVTESGESCPASSQVGTVEVTTGAGAGETRSFGLFNLSSAAGTAMRLGAVPFGFPIVFDATLRAGGEEAFGLSLTASEIPSGLGLRSLRLSLWGTPWDATHNTRRGNCLNESEPAFAWSKCSVGEPLGFAPRAFLTLPTECGEALAFTLRAETWSGGGEQAAGAVNRHPGGNPALIAGCETLPSIQTFDLAAAGLLSVKKASSSTGFVFRLRNDDEGLPDPRARIRSHPQRAVVELPDDVTLNPSLGAGLKGCAPAELARETAFNPPGAGCPNGSKIGVFSVRSPFYEGFLRGSVYLAKPRENPFDSLLAVYLVAKSADRGLLIRLPGELARNPGDGTITATFDGLPQIPYTDLEIAFRSGQRAPLVSPPRCGDATTRITLTPSSGGESVTYTTGSNIDLGIDSGPCPDGSTLPFAPGAVAGGVNSNVGSYTPYFIHLSRKDTEQEITSYSLVLPKGITGKLAGIPFCPEAAIAAARTRQGFDEVAAPSCPGASQVGRTDTGYGVGPALTYAPGRIYLAGPFGGSPLSLVTINAATVGPFDLGTIVIRSAFDVDQRTAQLQIDSSASDPIPHIIDGVPLHLRDIRIYMDRFQFTHNPSSCEPSQLVSTVTGSGPSFATPADDSTVSVADHFQLLNCLNLGFRPRLGLRLRGNPKRGGYPSLRANFVSRGERDSNLKRIQVEMPHSLFLAQNHIRTVCTRQQFAAERCPRGSIYGSAAAHTLLFDTPLRGNVYLRSSTGKLPDLVADLRSGSIRIVVEGRIGPGRHGGILTFFDNLPDAPIDRFTMALNGGRGGLLQNSSNICANPPLATVSALGQNNIGARFSSTLRGQCAKKGKRDKRGGRGR